GHNAGNRISERHQPVLYPGNARHAPEMHDPARHGHVAPAIGSPSLPFDLRYAHVSTRRAAWGSSRGSCGAGQGTNAPTARHALAKAVVPGRRNALDAVSLHRLDDGAHLGLWLDRHDMALHHFPGCSTMRLQILCRELPVLHEQLEPAATPALG